MKKVSKTAVKAAAQANVKVAKLQATRLNEALAAMGFVIPHGQALELIAKTMGARTWHAHQAELQQAAQPAAAATWNRNLGPMSFEYYRENPNICVVCGYEHIEGDEVDIGAGSATQEVGCPECGSEWEDFYELAGYTNLRIGDEAPITDPEFEKILAWLMAGPMSADEVQEQLDDMILDDVAEFGTAEANTTDDADEQEAHIGNAERTGADINNEGPLSQLRHLSTRWEGMKSFKAALALRFNVRPSDLKI